MKKKLIIHAGLHKTGTSAIQSALSKNNECLAERGYYFYNRKPDGTRSIDGNGSWWVNCLVDRFRESGAKFIEPERFAREMYYESELPNCVFSAEALSWIFNKEELENLVESLHKYFFHIEVCFYIRRQDRLLVSHNNQALKNLNGVAYKFYGESKKAIPEFQSHLDLYFDYFRRYELWSQILGDKKVHFYKYDEDKSFDVVEHFFNTLNLPKVTTEERLNVRVASAKAKVLKIANELGLDPNLKRLLTSFNDLSPHLLPDREDAFNFYSRYMISNKKLFKKTFGEDGEVFDLEFNEYPVKVCSNWSEEDIDYLVKEQMKIMNSIFTRFYAKELFMLKELRKLNKPIAVLLLDRMLEERPNNKHLKRLKFEWNIE